MKSKALLRNTAPAGRLQSFRRASILCLVFLAAMLPAGEFQLNPRLRKTVIVTPANPQKSVALAAAELAEHFALATGIRPPVLTSAAPIPENAFSFRLKTGPAPDAQLGFNNAAWICTEDSLAIYGNDENASEGTLYTVYDWLDRFLHCRWLWPGDLGRIVPKTDSIALSTGEGIYKPSLLGANWRPCRVNTELWYSKEAREQFFRLEEQWKKRNRLFNDTSQSMYPHAFEQWYDKYYEKHPDFFPLLPNGKRAPNPYYYNGAHRLTCMCVSNPEFAKQVVKDWLENFNPNAPRINLNENDTSGYCCCDTCLEWDESPIPIEERRARAKERFDAGDHSWFKALGSVTNRYAKFFMRVLEEVDRIAPERKAEISGDIYANYYLPPSIKLSPRIFLRYTPPLMFPWTQKKVSDYKKQWDQWAATGGKIMFRPNFTLDGHCFPINYAWHFTDVFRHCYNNSMFCVDMDSCAGSYAGNSLTMYAIPRIICHPDMSDEEILSEYLSAFGNARNEIRHYWQRLEELSDKFGSAEFMSDNEKIVGGGWNSFYSYAGNIFTQEVFDELFAILDNAAKLVKNDDIPSRRIEWLRLGLQQAHLVVLTNDGINIFNNTGDISVFSKYLVMLTEFRKLHEGDCLSNTGFLRKLEGYNWLNDEFTALQTLPLNKKNHVNLLNQNWGYNLQKGEFEPIKSRRFPLKMTCTAKENTSIYNGAWARFHQSVKVTPGEIYEFTMKYKTSEGCEGHPEIWLSGTSNPRNTKGKYYFNVNNTNGKERVVSVKIQPDLDSLSIYLTWIGGPGSVEIIDACLY